ncbi:MAG: adenylate/guanylate cyclase domain-containing protein, partial [Armatimonadota bacterium]
MPALPSGTIALLFTDVEGFTRHCAEDEAQTLAALRHHDALLRKVIEGRGGVVFKTVGDAFHAAFALPRDALAAAVEAQNRLQTEAAKGAPRSLHVRMALHIGTPECRDDDYFGLSVNAIARLRDLGHGGQILVSRAFYEMVHALTGSDATFRSLHAWHLKGMPHPETVFQVIAPGLPNDFPPLRAVSESVGNLPILLSSFIGRARSLTQVATQVEQHKLLTLRGAGGCGKTRLAIEAARPLAPGFPGGVWLVRLDGLDDPNLIAREAVRVLRLYQSPEQTPEQTLIERLRDRATLLLLDNCEHLLKGSARFAHSLLTACPDLRILATSREPLAIPGEYVREVPPLPLPRVIGKPSLTAVQASEAVQLFTARAEASGSFALTRQNAASVANICRALDGIPLALELAARWVGVLPLEEIAAELVELVNDPPDADDPEIVPSRQRTMRAAVDWSFQRLDEAEQAFFLQLAIFVGGFTLEAARAVAGPAAGSSVRALHLLKSLVDRSLVVFDENAKPEPRYRLLEPIREVAAEKLSGTPAEQTARNSHCAWFLQYALRAEPELQGADSVRWLDRLEADHE